MIAPQPPSRAARAPSGYGRGPDDLVAAPAQVVEHVPGRLRIILDQQSFATRGPRPGSTPRRRRGCFRSRTLVPDFAAQIAPRPSA